VNTTISAASATPPDGIRRPRFAVPQGACDCHMHIFDHRYPFMEGTHSRAEASVTDYRAVQAQLGTTRAVVVASSGYGLDNRSLIDATQQFGAEGRCIVAIAPDISPAALGELHARGARGFRFNLHRSKVNSIETLKPVAERVAAHGWHAQMWVNPDQLIACEPFLRDLPIPVVFDHLVRLPEAGGRTHAAYTVLRRLLDGGNTWLKVSLATASQLLGTLAQAELDAMVRELVAAAPDRLLWGSDWPHTTAQKESRTLPDNIDLLNLLGDWVPDEKTRNRILVDNPAALFGFST
jgi:D-galactarolactone isomerase